MITKIIIVIIIVYLLSQIKFRPVMVFWLSLMFCFDPGGIFGMSDEGNIIGRIKYYDAFFLFMLSSYYFSLNKYKVVIYKDEVKQIINLLVPCVIYYIIFSGIIIPSMNGYLDALYFIQKNRLFIYSLPILYFTIHFTKIDCTDLYKFIIWFSFIILSAFIFSVVTKINLISSVKISRFGQNDRIFLLSYSLFQFIIPLGIVIFSILIKYKLKFPYMKIIVIAMLLMLVTYLITLTRREYIRIGFMAIVIPLLVSYITRRPIFKAIRNTVLFLIPLGFVVSFVFPEYLSNGKKLVSDVYSLATSGVDTEGYSDSRLSGNEDYLIVKRLITENLSWGIGYYPANWGAVVKMKLTGNELGVALDASSEVPIYGAIMRLGVIGLIIPTVFYLYLIFLLFKIIRFTRENFHILIKTPIEVVILVTFIFTVIAKFTIEFYNLYGEFYLPETFCYNIVILGIILGVYSNLKKKVNEVSIVQYKQ